MAETKNITINSKIQSLDIISFKVEERKADIPVDNTKITFEIGLDVNVKTKEKLIIIISPVSIFSDASKKELLGSLQVKGEFTIENLEEIKQENGIPVPLLATFAGIVISTTRGMLRILGKGTAFADAIIPVVNPMALFNTIPQVEVGKK